MSAVVGRELELAAVEQLLSDGRSGFSALVLEGEAGIGKTTVWREAVRRAEDSGARVLACRPAQAEATLGYASLADLLRSLGDDELAELPDPQRRAIDVALLRRRGRAGADARAAATAVLSILSSVAREPVVVAIDDAQWLDASSATALSFALRRIPPDARLGLLLAVRLEDGEAATPLGLADLPTAVKRVRLAPLSLSAIYHIVRADLGLTLAPSAAPENRTGVGRESALRVGARPCSRRVRRSARPRRATTGAGKPVRSTQAESRAAARANARCTPRGRPALGADDDVDTAGTRTRRRVGASSRFA
jgi:predicted ATPase